MPASRWQQSVQCAKGGVSSMLTSGDQGRTSVKTRPASLVLVLCLVTAMAASAQTTFTSLFGFNGNNGNWPNSQLVQGFDGNLYGTTLEGGRFKGSCSSQGCGTVFRITTSGALTTIYAFCSRTNCTDGILPAGAVLATDGNFYGTTEGGGAHNGGTVFKLTPSGTLTTLYSFCVQTRCTDGALPEAGLVQAFDGDFYGTTTAGGADTTGCFNSGCGTVFKITPAGVLTTLHSFCTLANCADGSEPAAALIQAANGKLYGTTSGGGLNGSGTVFQIARTTGVLTTLYNFCSQASCSDGFVPLTALVQAASGKFYGTTYEGGRSRCGTSGLCGTLFTITASGTFSTLYQFCEQITSGDCTDGTGPNALVQATDGNFYGTTRVGGAGSGCGSEGAGCGTIFKITASGVLSTPYSFCPGGGCEGSRPDSLVQDTDGNLYGTTQTGGSATKGTVFRLSAGLGPFVKTAPNTGAAGTTVTILGTDLTGATSVSFHGTPAAFTVVSASEITTTVPTGATTGKVTVTTPSGTLLSNIAFVVP